MLTALLKPRVEKTEGLLLKRSIRRRKLRDFSSNDSYQELRRVHVGLKKRRTLTNEEKQNSTLLAAETE